MAYTAITAGEVDQDSPLDAGLMGKVKGNFDALAAGVKVLYRFGDHGSYYVDAAAATIEPGASYADQASDTSKAQLASVQFYVPTGVTSIYCNIRAACSRTNADCHYDVTIGGTTITFASLPGAASIAWQTAQAVTVSAGWVTLSANSHNQSSDPRTFQLSDLLIYTA